jgi:predicted transcriptional regulator
MKNDGYLSIVTSDKRISILYLLSEKIQDLSQIKTYLKVKASPEIVPRLKELKGAGLIEGDSSGFRITDLGRVYLKHLTPFLELTETLDKFPFWRDHDISGIPGDLKIRIQELKDCHLIEIRLHDMFESNAPFIENVKKSLRFKGTAHIFFPEWISLFLRLARVGVPIEIITTQGILEKIKDMYPDELEDFLQNGAHLYLADDSLDVTIGVTDLFTSFSLNYKNGLYDHSHNLQSVNNPLAIKWMSDLFEYHKMNSVEVKTSDILTTGNAQPAVVEQSLLTPHL